MGKSEILAKYPFRAFVDNFHRLNNVLDLSITGIQNISASVPLAQALADLPLQIKQEISDGEFDPEDDAKSVKRAEELAELAKVEINTGFNLLHSQALITHWGALESLVFNIAVTRIRLDDEVLKNDYFKKIKIPLADFHRLDVDDRLDLLVQEMIREKRAEFKPGVGKFEAILEEINLSGQVDDDTRKKLYELSKARNVLVHRAGIVDIKLLEDCPWLDYEVGKPLIIDREKYSKYLTAVIAYLTH